MYALLKIEELDFLVKYGIIDLPSSRVTDNGGYLESSKCLFGRMEPVEFPDNYALVYIDDSASVSENRIGILSVKYILPVAKNGMYVFEEYVPFFTVKQYDSDLESCFLEINHNKFVEHNCQMGIRVFRQFCGLDPSIDPLFEREIIDGIMYRKKKHYDIPFENRNCWNMLLSYDRYSAYGNDHRGYFLDLIEIMMYLTKRDLCGYVDGLLEGKKTAIAVMENDGDGKFQTVVDGLKKDERTRKLFESIDEKYNSVYVPIAFLYFKEEIRKSLNDTVLNNLAKFKQEYRKEFDIIATLIGGFFGYENLREGCLGKYMNKSFKVAENAISEPASVGVVPSKPFDKVIPKLTREQWSEALRSAGLKGARMKRIKDMLLDEALLDKINESAFGDLWDDVQLSLDITQKQLEKIKKKIQNSSLLIEFKS